jgi:hypothetical protein
MSKGRITDRGELQIRGGELQIEGELQTRENSFIFGGLCVFEYRVSINDKGGYC